MAETVSEQIRRDFFAVEDVLRHQRVQRESVKGKDTPFRVVFRYSGGTRSYQYFTALRDCDGATDRRARYGPTGRAWIDKPLSQYVEVRGPRGGWKRPKLVASDAVKSEGSGVQGEQEVRDV